MNYNKTCILNIKALNLALIFNGNGQKRVESLEQFNVQNTGI